MVLRLLCLKEQKNIKIDYNISWEAAAAGTNGFDLDVYDKDIGGTVPFGTQNIIGTEGFLINKGQNKIGTYYFNSPPVKSFVINGNGINGTVKIYTSS